MAGTFAYAYPNLTATAGTSVTPADFAAMHAADLAGTLVLLAAAACTINMTLTIPVQPAEDLALPISFTLASTSAGAGDTLDITGTNFRGSAQTESIDVSAGDGAYTGAKFWRTISDIDCTGWEDGTLAVSQNRWGAIFEYVAGALYRPVCNILFGDGSTPTYFTSLNEMVYFDDGFKFGVKSAATLRIGQLSGNWARNGSMWNTKYGASWDIIDSGSNTATMLLYGGMLAFRDGGGVHLHQWKAGTLEAKNFIFSGGGTGSTYLLTGLNISSVILNKVFVTNCAYWTHGRGDVISDFHQHLGQTRVNNNITIQNLLGTAISQIATNSPISFILKNPLFSLDSISKVIDNASGGIIENYPVNIHIADKNGTDLAAATVSLTSFGNIVSPDAGANFYRCIVGHTAGTFATDLAAGKWILTTAAYAALAGVTGAAQAGAWVTGIAYTAAATEFSVATAANGDIAEQTVTYKKWIGTSEAMLSYSPHTLTVHKDGIGTYIDPGIVVSAPITNRLKLMPGRRNIGFSGLNPVGSKGMSL